MDCAIRGWPRGSLAYRPSNNSAFPPFREYSDFHHSGITMKRLARQLGGVKLIAEPLAHEFP